MGAPPSKYDIAIDLSQMNRIVAYDPGDLTLSVESGVTLASLASTLAEHGQMLPLGAPWAAHATIGGSIASGIDAPERQLYGTPRDYLLGAEFVTGDGVLAKSGGRVVKNVTGYDIHKLLIGSFATLGIVTKLNFKTFPLPQNVRGFAARFEKLEGALAMRSRVAQSPLSPITVEILGPGVAYFFSKAPGPAAFPPDILHDKQWNLALSFSGSSAMVARYEKALREIAEQCGATFATAVTEGSDTNAILSRIREFPSHALKAAPALTIQKLGVLPSKLGEVWSSVGAAAKANRILHIDMIRGIGIAYIAALAGETSSPSSDDAKQRMVAFTKAVQAAAAQVGGYATIPWCPSAWKRELSVWGPPPPDLAEMRKLKAALDPQNILSPGRFVGGI